MKTIQRKALMPQKVYARAGAASLEGELHVPDEARGLVVFVHGSGSATHSPRDRFMAAKLHEQHLATFMIELLTAEEEADDLASGKYRFDIAMLAKRLGEVSDALARDPAVRGLPVAYLATGTGAAAAIVAAADKPVRAAAIISRGGRVDLAGPALPRVKAPTLLIVGGEDRDTLDLNQDACNLLRCPKELRVVAGTKHLFEEPGAIEEVEALVYAWVEHHLQPEMAAT